MLYTIRNYSKDLIIMINLNIEIERDQLSRKMPYNTAWLPTIIKLPTWASVEQWQLPLYTMMATNVK